LKYYELLSEGMKATLSKAGFTTPTPIQARTLELTLGKWDILGIAQTGTGKTAAFAVPIIERTFINNRKTQALVICPTRELAMQITEVFRKLSEHAKLRVVSLYGGQAASVQIRALRAGAHIVVGTPGRIKDLINRNVLKLQNIRTVVLDEADEMLSFGFLPDITAILSQITKEHQTLLFSATMNRAVSGIVKQFQHDAVRIELDGGNQTAVNVTHSYLPTSSRGKCKAVQQLLQKDSPRLALVFCNTKRQVKMVHQILNDQGLTTGCLHGDLSQYQRDTVMNAFRKGTTNVMVATDVAARGIDVKDIDLVINYDVPDKMEYYVHRIGRTGRAGRPGRACTLVNAYDSKIIADIERRFRIEMTQEQAM